MLGKTEIPEAVFLGQSLLDRKKHFDILRKKRKEMLKDAHTKVLTENHLMRENQELREIIDKNMSDKEEILERRLQKLNINLMRKLE